MVRSTSKPGSSRAPRSRRPSTFSSIDSVRGENDISIVILDRNAVCSYSRVHPQRRTMSLTGDGLRNNPSPPCVRYNPPPARALCFKLIELKGSGHLDRVCLVAKRVC